MVEEAVNFLREMFEKHRSADFITYQTVLDEMCRQGRTEDSMQLLKELQEKELVDGHTYRKLLNVLEDDFGNSSYRNRFRYELKLLRVEFCHLG
ncbi:pentatricopeptide repeat-containing protein At2g27800, mitochondrial-like isoform X2 [Vitis riparia]|uniref:pentatricopeptide repeat-containing protein At2g27800, mitochondrial-like isoform X2 n=1 Tax=Vitis riparia TaxID=96939 RepID=UPI00155A1342|nr:pentatricopeptide repeat-containing protein At2g27800, mitochondrial-like isoform X2 [Vitis riparia]